MSQLDANQEFNLYRDISQRTGGEIYVGVVGPVRTGKSTFIKRFMDLMVLPQIENEHERVRTQDELPQSSGGRTITTTEPKFIPKEAAQIDISDGINVKVRLIDCVGYMVEGAAGHMEEDAERMVKTPWSREEIPFTQAAEIGTRKVIKDHSTIGIVVLRTEASVRYRAMPTNRRRSRQSRSSRRSENLLWCLSIQQNRMLMRQRRLRQRLKRNILSRQFRLISSSSGAMTSQ